MDWIRRRRPAAGSPDASDTNSWREPDPPPTSDATFAPGWPDATFVPTRPDATRPPARHDPPPAETPGRSGWRLGAWDEPDLAYAKTLAALDHSHRLRCTTRLDPAGRRHAEAVAAWALAPAPSVLFFVEENNAGTSYVSIDHGAADNRVALEALRSAQQRLRDDRRNAPGGYLRARARADQASPPVSWWY